MAEKMLVTLALDERDALVLKIDKKIEALNIASVKRKKDPQVKNIDGHLMDIKDYENLVKSEWQSLQDMIARYNRICVAIIQSNAVTKIKVGGKEMTVAQAIAFKQTINSSRSFESKILKKLEYTIELCSQNMSNMTHDASIHKDRHISMLIGKDKNISDKDMKIIDDLMEDELPEMIDPLNLQDLYKEKDEEYSDIIRNINSAIKISNATTEIEF